MNFGIKTLAALIAAAIAAPAAAEDDQSSITEQMVMQAIAEGRVVYVPEGGELACTIDLGCAEIEGRVDYDSRTQMEAQPLLLGAARGMMVERAERALEAIRALSPRELLTAELARAVVRDLRWSTIRGATWAAREHVFDEHQCGIFAHYENPTRTCRSTRAFEGSDAEHLGVPTEIMPAIVEMRSVLFATGRMYLKQPANLRVLYEDVKPAMIDEYSKLLFQEQEDFVALLDLALATLGEYQDTAVLEALDNLYEAERRVWMSRGRDDADQYAEEREAARVSLEELTTDVQAVQFWHRRYLEGGPQLLKVYGDIVGDLREAVRPTPTPSVPE